MYSKNRKFKCKLEIKDPTDLEIIKYFPQKNCRRAEEVKNYNKIL